MLMDYFTIDDFDVEGRSILLRIDVNSEVIDGRVLMNERIREHARTIKELCDRGAKVVAMSHQGRAGGRDFITLEQHAALLSKFTPVEFVDDIIGPAARLSIESLEEGSALLLDNVRLLAEETLELPPEEHAKSIFVRKLASLFDIFINDAFSVAHRSHASVVGFAKVLPSGVGRVMEQELQALQRATQNTERPCIYIIGGAKYEDAFSIIEHVLSTGKADKVLVTGFIANLFLAAKGFFEMERYLEAVRRARNILRRFGEKIELPEDVAVEENGERREVAVSEVEPPIYDIGTGTIEKYLKMIESAKTIIMKGPAGVYEREEFRVGTKALLEGVASAAAFSLLGGGDTSSAINVVGLDKSRFSYVSLAGGALLRYLSGRSLPGLDVLARGKSSE
ncbi:MAG: 3-phosphoglycerate kinase [Candidatus Alkanophagales archaeon MCA70_species_1]|nr:3-phosphoglycerate kinase [Candidatus Alkanophaga volatiphilum]